MHNVLSVTEGCDYCCCCCCSHWEVRGDLVLLPDGCFTHPAWTQLGSVSTQPTDPSYQGLIHTGCADASASKWNLLLSVEVFTLDTSNIKGISRKFACSRPVWIGPERDKGWLCSLRQRQETDLLVRVYCQPTGSVFSRGGAVDDSSSSTEM